MQVPANIEIDMDESQHYQYSEEFIHNFFLPFDYPSILVYESFDDALSLEEVKLLIKILSLFLDFVYLRT